MMFCQKRTAGSEPPPRRRAIRSHCGGTYWLLTQSARQQFAAGRARLGLGVGSEEEGVEETEEDGGGDAGNMGAVVVAV